MPISERGFLNMKIAVTYENENVFQHFGHTHTFKIYEVQDKNIIKSELIPAPSAGHGALAGFLAASGVDVLICGGIGEGAQNTLNQVNIKFYGGITGNADEAVKRYIAGNLGYVHDICCTHHSEKHSCGNSCH